MAGPEDLRSLLEEQRRAFAADPLRRRSFYPLNYGGVSWLFYWLSSAYLQVQDRLLFQLRPP